MKDIVGKKSKKVNLSAVVEETLRKRILNLEYPHNHILGEEALCLEFSVSRSPVREALRLLEASGLIHKMNNRSYVVKQINQSDVRELYELRLAMEKFIVEKLCHESDDNKELTQLYNYWKSIELKSEEELANADREFHEALAAMYGNSAIIEELSIINDRLRVFRVVDFSKQNRVETTKRQHTELLKAISDKDVKKALDYLEVNINEGLENALEALREAILRAYER